MNDRKHRLWCMTAPAARVVRWKVATALASAAHCLMAAFCLAGATGCSDAQVPDSEQSPVVSVRLRLVEPNGANVDVNAELHLEAITSHSGRVDLVAMTGSGDERRIGPFMVVEEQPLAVTTQGRALPIGHVSVIATLATSWGAARSEAVEFDIIETDADGDASSTRFDCQDADAAIHPGAVEMCDGVDQDCDAATDESCHVCHPGQEEACYSGEGQLEDPTLQHGACHPGTRRCGEDGAWQACADERLPSPEACESTVDDLDCDGLTGCNDPSCSGAECTPVRDCVAEGCGHPECAGEVCWRSEGGQGRCVDGDCRTAEIACDDESDDDQDGVADCQDSDCAGKRCGPGKVCTGTVCQLSREYDCGDAIDDDGDGLTDCADPNCPSDTPCGDNRVCRNGACRLATEPECGNEVDDDGDAMTDCADTEDCPAGSACGSHHECSVGACILIPERDCSNGADDDADTAVDCRDTDCNGKVCAASPQGAQCPTGARRCSQGECVSANVTPPSQLNSCL